MKKTFLFLLMGLLAASMSWAVEDVGLSAGILAPDFKAVTHQGDSIQLSEILKEGPVVLVFYRGSWCMYCNMHLQELQSHLEDFKKYGARVVAVSVDRQENAAKIVEEKTLGFTVISDPEADLLKLYNVVYQVPDELSKKYKKEYDIDLEAASGRTDHIIAIPATYVIDQMGLIIYANANENYKVRPPTDEVLDVLKMLIEDPIEKK